MPCTSRAQWGPCFLTTEERAEQNSLYSDWRGDQSPPGFVRPTDSKNCLRCVRDKLYAIEVEAAVYQQLQEAASQRREQEKGKGHATKVPNHCSSCGWESDCAGPSSSGSKGGDQEKQ